MHSCVPRSLLPIVLAVIAIATSGCGKTGPQRFEVTGTVTYDGEPLPRGTIRFEPDASKGNRGPVGIAAIEAGRYSTAEEGARGVLQGPLVVWITGLPEANPNAEFQKPLFTDYRAEIELPPGHRGPARFDFDIPAQRRP
jgi:hypothetical protein